ncbi:MAG: metallophosphoesterase [Clostridia bacterium]|nr:metallophosphoesterase [Clostridia bacterium]
MKKRLLALILALSLLLTGCAELDKLQAELDQLLSQVQKPETPETPDTPSTPNNPDNPGNPSNPDDPTVPDAPEGKPQPADKATDGHTDKNNDGWCDDCRESVIIVFDFYAVNDLHGKFDDAEGIVGVGGLTTYLKTEMAKDDNAILLASGDMWQGSAHSNLPRGNIVTEWMNHMGFVSMTMGNHEYDWGRAPIEANAALAEFPFLGINVYDTETGEQISYCDSSVVVEQNGLRVGIIGAIGDVYGSIAEYMREGFEFKTGTLLTELVRREATRLRTEEGVDYIVFSTHSGYMAYPQLDGYVDIIFEGHSHSSYVKTDDFGTYHLQGGGDNRGISHAEVTINFANGNSTVNEAETVSNYIYSSYTADPIVAELILKYNEEVGWVDDPLGTVSSYLSSSDIKRLVAELYYRKGEELWGDEYDIVLGGGLLNTRSPHNIQAGPVTYIQLLPILPFDNELSLAKISGYDLKRIYQGTSYTYYLSPEHQDLFSTVENDKYYYVVTDRYSSAYSPNNMEEIAILNENIYARDLLAAYIKEGGLE